MAAAAVTRGPGPGLVPVPIVSVLPLSASAHEVPQRAGPASSPHWSLTHEEETSVVYATYRSVKQPCEAKLTDHRSLLRCRMNECLVLAEFYFAAGRPS